MEIINIYIQRGGGARGSLFAPSHPGVGKVGSMPGAGDGADFKGPTKPTGLKKFKHRFCQQSDWSLEQPLPRAEEPHSSGWGGWGV